MSGKRKSSKKQPATRRARAARSAVSTIEQVQPVAASPVFEPPLALLEEWEEHFCWNYTSTINATRSYLRVRPNGTAESAAVSAHRLLSQSRIQQRIVAIQKELRHACQVEAHSVIRELKRIAFARLSDVVEWEHDETGRHFRLKVKASVGLDDDTLAAVAEISRDDTKHGVKVRVKMHDKVAALVNLGKALGMFTDVVKHEGEVRWVVEAPPQMSPEDWAQRYGQQASKGGKAA